MLSRRFVLPWAFSPIKTVTRLLDEKSSLRDSKLRKFSSSRVWSCMAPLLLLTNISLSRYDFKYLRIMSFGNRFKREESLG